MQIAGCFRLLRAKTHNIVQKRLYSSKASYYKTTNEIRSAYLKFYEKNGHKIFPSSNLVPENDPSLYFTTAGMVQFKDYFLGIRKPEHARVTTAQKCVRAGGKHNDLDNVGYTSRHLTFFEMLGNFSFGSYFKEGAIDLAWTFLTKELGMPKERLAVSVLEGDEETADIWKKNHGLPDSKIFRKGKEDNFWAMNDSKGPCGPCSEIFWDQQTEIDGERFLEIWNLVFMQYENNAQGRNFTPLPVPCIDTGMGLERLASVLQGKTNNYDIDSMAMIMNAVRPVIIKKTGKTYGAEWETSVRVITDHIRSASFLISEGLTPGMSGRGYVLKRIIRRAVRYGHKLGIREPFLAEIVPALIDSIGDTYPELAERIEVIQRTLSQEENAFLMNLDRALEILEQSFVRASVSARAFINLHLIN
jgi:alanyl-tRNA synthetase